MSTSDLPLGLVGRLEKLSLRKDLLLEAQAVLKCAPEEDRVRLLLLMEARRAKRARFRPLLRDLAKPQVERILARVHELQEDLLSLSALVPGADEQE